MRLFPIAISAVASIIALTIFQGVTPRVLPHDVTIDASNIATFRLDTAAPSKDEERPLTLAMVSLLGVVVIGLARSGPGRRR